MSEEICFLQGKLPVQAESVIEKLKEKISEFSNVKNLHFLLGAGTSSGAIPSMKVMNQEITKEIQKSSSISTEVKELFNELSGDNLETTLGLLYARRYYLEGTKEIDIDKKKTVDSLISYIEHGLFKKINVGFDNKKSIKTLTLYKQFYQKISLRNKDLSRVNIFTTNNDLFNERALDNLNIDYNNGFGGGLERVFNPARFNYTFSKKIDSNLEKFEPLENMVYLYKLHGSISWVEKEGNSLFNIQEVPIESGIEKINDEHVLIYPTPLKQNQSLGAPYSDLIRSFQLNLTKANSVLLVIGYSFSDEHLNNIIYQALASNSSLSIVIFGDYSSSCPLTKIEDSRIYQVFTKGKSENPVHYFDRVVNELLPDMDENKEKKLLENFIQEIKKTDKQSEKNESR